MTQSAAYFMGIMGLLFFLPPLIVIAYKLYFRVGCKKAIGKCVRIERNRDPDTGSMMINPVIEFMDIDGRQTEFKTNSGYGLKYMPRVNSTVKIYYRPDSYPLRAQVASRGLWEVSGILMLVGLVLMLPVILYIWSQL